MTTRDVPPHLDGDRLDRAVHRVLEDAGVVLGRADAKRLVEGGRVQLDGRVDRRGSTRVRSGQSLRIDVDEGALASRRAARATRRELEDERVLLRARGVMWIDKPAGLPSHATRDPRRDHLEAAVARWIETTDGGPPPVVRTVHRLDRDTSGVVVLTEDGAMHGVLSEAFADRAATKTYVAICHGADLADTGRCDVRLDTGRDGTVRPVRRGGRSARTDWRVVARVDGLAIVELRPATGRKHQLRAHLAAVGAPIVHDARYGGAPARGSERCQLHALSLALPVPWADAPLRVEAPWPEDFIAPRPAAT